MRNVLMFTLALNGFDKLFKHNIKTQERYAKRCGFHFQVVSQPSIAKLGMELVWLKLTLMREALEVGYDWVLYVDADAEVKVDAPDMLTEAVCGKTFYLANGISGRLNSGVILMRNTPHALPLLETIIDNAQQPIPDEDDVGWGENGHVIHYLKNSPHLQVLSGKWNNNSLTDLADYIRHYSHGPLYHQCTTSLYGTLYVRLIKLYVQLLSQPAQPFSQALNELTLEAKAHHSYFTQHPQWDL